jgi:hypothetical protein
MSLSPYSSFELSVADNNSSSTLTAEFLLAVLAAGKRPASLSAAVLTEQSRSTEGVKRKYSSAPSPVCGEQTEPRRGT